MQLVLSKRITCIEIGQDLFGIFMSVQIDDNEMQRGRNLQFSYIDTVTVEFHKYGATAVCAGLIKATAARRGGNFTAIGHLHFTPDGHFKVINTVECPGDQDTECGTRRESLLDREVGAVIVDGNTANTVVRGYLICHTRNIAKKTAVLRFFQKRFALHRNFVFLCACAVVKATLIDNLSGILFHRCIDSLVRTGYDRVALFELTVYSAVASRPVAVFSKEAYSSGNKQFHYVSFI